MEIYDISQTLCRGIAVWPGDPEFQHRWAAQIRAGEISRNLPAWTDPPCVQYCENKNATDFTDFRMF
jgi:hypothetical protein